MNERLQLDAIDKRLTFFVTGFAANSPLFDVEGFESDFATEVESDFAELAKVDASLFGGMPRTSLSFGYQDITRLINQSRPAPRADPAPRTYNCISRG